MSKIDYSKLNRVKTLIEQINEFVNSTKAAAIFKYKTTNKEVKKLVISDDELTTKLNKAISSLTDK